LDLQEQLTTTSITWQGCIIFTFGNKCSGGEGTSAVANGRACALSCTSMSELYLVLLSSKVLPHLASLRKTEEFW